MLIRRKNGKIAQPYHIKSLLYAVASLCLACYFLVQSARHHWDLYNLGGFIAPAITVPHFLWSAFTRIGAALAYLDESDRRKVLGHLKRYRIFFYLAVETFFVLSILTAQYDHPIWSCLSLIELLLAYFIICTRDCFVILKTSFSKKK